MVIPSLTSHSQSMIAVLGAFVSPDWASSLRFEASRLTGDGILATWIVSYYFLSYGDYHILRQITI